MSARAKLKKALSSIDDAIRKLKRTYGDLDSDSENAVRRAVRDLEDAEGDVKKAIRELPPT